MSDSRIVISSEARNLCHSRLRDSRFPHMCRALLRFPQLSFIPLEPYPARYARHLPHAGKALMRGKQYSHFVAFIGGARGAAFCMTAEQPLEEGARRRRGIDPHSGKK